MFIQKCSMNKSACSVAATYKPPMLVPRVRLPAGALTICLACLQAKDEKIACRVQVVLSDLQVGVAQHR